MLDWLIDIREEKGFTRKAVAEKVDVSQPTYCNIENGKRGLRVETAKKIAEVLGFDWQRFFEEETA